MNDDRSAGAEALDEVIALFAEDGDEEGVSLVEAWVDPHDANAICVVFRNTKHAAQASLTCGLRWDVRIDPESQLGPPGSAKEVAGLIYYRLIVEPLSRALALLRFDAHGIGWFGVFDEFPPRRSPVPRADLNGT